MAVIVDGRMLIGGKLVSAKRGRWMESIDPANEEVIGRVPLADEEDMADAVDSALDASASWAGLSMVERGDCLRAYAHRLSEESERILGVEVRDTGNTISKLRDDVASACRSIEYFAGLGLELKGDTIPATAGGLHFSLRQPYGVVGRIVPFNHPIMFAARCGGPLIAGNTVVIKPSEQSPLSAAILGEICQETLPPGVVNIVTGGGSAGEALVRHPAVKRISFTGSVPTGMAIQRSAAEVAVKHISLELGGKNPMIVFPDADAGQVAAAAVAGMNFAWQGQSCGSVSRLLVHEDLYDTVLNGVVRLVEGLRLGDPALESSMMGPVNSKRQYDKVLSYIGAGREDGARLVTGGQRPEGEEFARGYWILPTVFADVTRGMRIFREEIFGPVLSVSRWSDRDDIVELANSVEYGLTAAIWTSDLTAGLRAARDVKAGYVWLNGVSRHYPGCSFGGFKNSGIGREEGLDELLSYTESKTVHVPL
jgi:acyl-CoA reductase-like NAD-dependent aldehyde dehydrogenase